MGCQEAFVLLAICIIAGEITANTILRDTTLTSASPGLTSEECETYTQSGEGNFKLQRKHYTSRKHGFYIKEVILVQRTSFYKCEPRKDKYGIEATSNTWWVDRGCEGIFQVTVCPDSGDKPHPHPENWRGTVYSELLLQLQIPVKPIDWTHFNMEGVENRFDYQSGSKQDGS